MERDCNVLLVVHDQPPAGEAVDRVRAQLLAGAAALAEPVLTALPVTDEGTSTVHAALHGLYWLSAELAAAQRSRAVGAGGDSGSRKSRPAPRQSTWWIAANASAATSSCCR